MVLDKMHQSEMCPFLFFFSFLLLWLWLFRGQCLLLASLVSLISF